MSIKSTDWLRLDNAAKIFPAVTNKKKQIPLEFKWN